MSLISKILIAACFVCGATLAFAQQSFDPDRAAYEIDQRGMSLASYARALEAQNKKLQSQATELQKQVDDLTAKYEPKPSDQTAK